MFELKDYQARSLDTLATYLRRSGETDPDLAFYELTRHQYVPVPELPGMPYVCLRVPTGGGKTLMACHTVGLTTRELLHADHALVLWLVPTNQIREQTLQALRDRAHPYRQALEGGLSGGTVSVLDLTEALYLPRATLDADTCVIVSTLAALRVQDTEGRKVYESAGALMSHFQGLSPEQRARLETEADGVVPYSLANVLRLRRPVVIMDEAHNARTKLSFATLARFEPSCVLEFTATPEQEHDPAKGRFASNVLHHVSAWELKAEAMIKMPIHLETRPDWREVVAEALRKRDELEQAAAAEQIETGEYLRPIVLFQAQPRNAQRETLTAEVLEKTLTEEFDVDPDAVRVATGERRGIAGEDLSALDCPVRFIITVQALKEGWDCPFAYVLCSVSEVGAPTAVEQILGRIMRLPAARAKRHDPLNAAYAFVASPRVYEAAERLQDGLIANGFDRFEARHMLGYAQPDLFEAGTLFDESARAPSPAQRGERFSVPLLAQRVGGQLELWEPETFLPDEWDLAACDPSLSQTEFPADPAGASALIEARENGIKFTFLRDVQRQVALLQHEDAWSTEKLANWLDRTIPHPDVPQPSSSLFLYRLVEHLVSARGIGLPDLTRDRYRLARAAADRIAFHRAAARHAGMQAHLLNVEQIEVSPALCFEYHSAGYPANPVYQGSYAFRNHFFTVVGAMNDEEVRCAAVIEALPEVKHWVRNLERRPRHSFWLPTPTDLFYPDFVAELLDGRYLVIEYKGEMLREHPDTEQKDILGRLWAQRSNGLCIFHIATKDNLDMLPALLR